MDSLLIGSAQYWLDVAAATLGPLTALIVGFEGADWFLRRRLGEASEHAPLGEPRAPATGRRGPALLGHIGRRI